MSYLIVAAICCIAIPLWFCLTASQDDRMPRPRRNSNGRPAGQYVRPEPTLRDGDRGPG